MNARHVSRFFAASFVGVTPVLALIFIFSAFQSPSALGKPLIQAAGIIRYVALTGNNVTNDCSNDGAPCQTIQYAIDMAQPGDEIRIAAGIYTDIIVREGITQVAYIDKTIAVAGGYTITNWVASYPLTQPTTLDAQEQGRAVFITGDISPTLEGLRITGGTADAGGGLFIQQAAATVRNNEIFGNQAIGNGGGVCLQDSSATLSDNSITANTAEFGGGLTLWNSPALLSGNLISGNGAGPAGGGLYLSASNATLVGNTIISNTADFSGSGLYLDYSDAMLIGNTISDNGASNALFLWHSDAVLDANLLRNNQNTAIFMHFSFATLTNNLIADNLGNGMDVDGSSPRLLHNTIVRNNQGVYVTSRWEDGIYYTSTVALTNTILADNQVGIHAADDTSVLANGVLWYGVPVTISQSPTATVLIQNQRWGDPAFAADGYHLTPASAAMDAGVLTSLTTDIDSQSRPAGAGYDLGADEFHGPGLAITKQANPEWVRAGEPLTYTIRLSNTGTVALHARVTDTLPSYVSPGGILTWSPASLAPSGIWTQQVYVTVNVGFTGTLTNIVEVTTSEGVIGAYTTTIVPRTCWARLNDDLTDYSSVQAAIDVAQPGDVVKVAGFCTDLNDFGGSSQVIYLYKTLTIQGGYTATNWMVSDPIGNPTTLDARGQGRAVFMTGDISPTLEGLRITGGTANEGGGLFILQAAATVRNNEIVSNHATGSGGGVYLDHSPATLSGNSITANTAEFGGGLALWNSPALLSDNHIDGNVAGPAGGGLHLSASNATLANNSIISNTADLSGAGLYLDYSDATLTGNAISGNDTGNALFLWHSNAALDANILRSNQNTAVFMHASAATLTNNLIADNLGGGIDIDGSSPRLLHNTIVRNNEGVFITSRWEDGTYYTSTVALTNTILADNQLGIYAGNDTSVLADGLLWYAVPITLSQAPTTTVLIQNQRWGDPAFAADGYHLTPASAAMDTGMEASVTTDIDGHHRPYGSAPDMGADEIIAAPVPTDTGNTLIYTDTQSLPTIVQIPSGAVTSTTTLLYSPLSTTTSNSQFTFAGHAFELDAYRDGVLLSNFTFSVPITITLHYTDTDVSGIDETLLKLDYWNSSTSRWEDAATTCIPLSTYDRHPDENWLAISICHLSRFALFGGKQYSIYLPLLVKN
jgi:uncharacterized repeat protein (TIGR01451 family)